MNPIVMSLRARINNYAKKANISAQVVLQNYMFERFLERLSKSPYVDKFVIKGGMLVSSIVGLDTRSTMDLNATLKEMPLKKNEIQIALETISNISIEDDTKFNLISIKPIRKDDIYGGFCVRIDAVFDTIITPLSIDISTGDVITPNPVKYEINGIFNDDLHIGLWGYNIETILAEKVETILSRGVLNTRPRDYYDVYILSTTKKFDKEIFKEALDATSEHRGSKKAISDPQKIIDVISVDEGLRVLWEKYQSRFSYAKSINYLQIIESLKTILGVQ